MNSAFEEGPSGLLFFIKHPFALLSQPYFWLGCIIYAVATALYIYVISKYSYGISYAIIVGYSAVLATVVSTRFFHESIRPVNYLGVMVILLGILLVVKK